MTSAATGRRIDGRLRELHARIADEPLPGDERYYVSGRGYLAAGQVGAERDHFAISVATIDGEHFDVGDRTVAFPLHSVSKVFTYALALADHGPDRVLERVGVEPSGDPFNALRVDERTMRPYNPMVNAGALVTNDLLVGTDPDQRLARALQMLRDCAGDQRLAVDPVTLDAEVAHADRNRGAAYLMRSVGMLHGQVDDILRLYLAQCSVHVTTASLATMGATLANGGRNPITGTRILPRRLVRDVLSVMHTCGMYDYAGYWAFEVGIPAKSGVGGAILAVIPGKLGIGVYSPGLDGHGNSVRGIRVCRELSERLGLHVFATPDEDALLTTASPSQRAVPPSVEPELPPATELTMETDAVARH